MIDPAHDFLQQGFLKQDFLKHYQELAQQAWESWMRQLQQPGSASHPFGAFNAADSGAAASDDLLTRSLSGMKQYFDWMQTASGTFGQPNPGQLPDWRQQLQQVFGSLSQPFASAFAGIDSHSAQGFAQQWQSWLQAMQQGGFGDLRGLQPMAPFGLSREQQLQQQALMAAMLEYLETSRRYQALLQKANAQAAERLQDKLTDRDEPGRQIESLKALYDLWVDAAEESYTEIALSDEFREVYGAMVNAQMRARALQQQQIEQWCRELGMPTRSEVASLGQRLQEIRRELRAGNTARDDAARDDDRAAQTAALRAELAVLKKQPAAVRKKAEPKVAAKPSLKAAAAKKAAISKAVPQKTASSKSAAGKKSGTEKPVQVPTRKSAPKAAARTAARKSVSKTAPRTTARKRK